MAPTFIMIDMQTLQYQKLVPHQVEYHAIYSGTHYYRTTHYRKLFILVLSTYLLVMGFLTVAVDNTVQNQNQHVASKTFLSCFPFSCNISNAMYVLSNPGQCKFKSKPFGKVCRHCFHIRLQSSMSTIFFLSAS